MSDLVKRYRQLQEVIGGCHDGYCVVRKPKGMHTNGGCNCLEDLRLHERSRIGGLLRCAQGMADRIEELERAVRYEADIAQQALDSRKELQAKLAKVVEALSAVEGWSNNPEIEEFASTTLAELTGGKDENSC